MTYAQLREKLVTSYDAAQMALLDKAFAFADKYHAGQKRFSGEPYVIHVLETAGILFELHSDPDTVAERARGMTSPPVISTQPQSQSVAPGVRFCRRLKHTVGGPMFKGKSHAKGKGCVTILAWSWIAIE